MKAFLTLVLILIFGATAVAHQNDTSDEKVKIHVVVSLLDRSADIPVAVEKNIAVEKQVVRVYLSKNSRIKKALSFSTKKSRPKLS